MLDAQEVHLPPGDWYDFWTSSKPADREHIRLHPGWKNCRCTFAPGAILPMQTWCRARTETPAGPLKLRVYPGEDCRGSLYMDDGHTFAYQKDEVLRIKYSCQVSANSA